MSELRRFDAGRTILMVAGVVLALLVVMGLVLLGVRSGVSDGGEVPVNQNINSFQECADAGYPIAESYPEQCFTPDGRGFTREIP